MIKPNMAGLSTFLRPAITPNLRGYHRVLQKFDTVRKDENAITKKVDSEEVKIMEGTISDLVSDSYCWVVPMT